MTPPACSRRALTLIEMIVALAVFALAATALVVTLRSGLRTWERVTAIQAEHNRVRFALDQLTRDAGRAVLLTGTNDTPPQLNDAELSWVTVLPATAPTALPRFERVRVAPEFQTDGALALVRRTAPYPADPSGPLGRAQVVLSPIRSCRFAFLTIDPESGAMVWRDQWVASAEFPPALPRVIRMTLDSPAWPQPITAVFDIPAGSAALPEPP